MAVKGRRLSQTLKQRRRKCRSRRCLRRFRQQHRAPKRKGDQWGGAGIPLLEGLPEEIPVPPPTTNESLNILFGEIPATNQGPLLTRAAATPQPRTSWDIPPLKNPYTLLVWDPDAPRPNAPYLHWLVMNIGGSTDSTGSTVVPWAPPTPPAGTGEHRYIFGLFKQANRIQELPEPPAERAAFDLLPFLKRHGLSLVAAKGVRVAAEDS